MVTDPGGKPLSRKAPESSVTVCTPTASAMTPTDGRRAPLESFTTPATTPRQGAPSCACAKVEASAPVAHASTAARSADVPIRCWREDVRMMAFPRVDAPRYRHAPRQARFRSSENAHQREHARMIRAVHQSPAMDPPSAAAPALAVRGLRKRYGDVVAVDGLDLAVATGECFGLLGPNGAGKTTTIEICEGLNTPDEGDVLVLGRRWKTDERALRERLGIQLQETQLTEKITVAETLRLFRSFFARGREVDEVIRLVQLDEKRNARVGKLSGGQKQRLALAC